MKKLLLLVPALILVTLTATRVISIVRHDEEPIVVHDIWNTPISREVKAVLIESFGPDALNIVVGVDRNVAVLSGDVSDRATQELSERVVESVDGILVVHNFIDLAPGNATATRAELLERDKILRARVSRELNAAVAVAACDGVVLLKGVMPDRDRHDTAIRIAENLEGVRKVIDRLHVTWTSPVSVASLTFGAESMTPYGKEK
jgi:osmotically-inducible protein OsmY